MTNSTSSVSRRKFIQSCAWSAAALAASPILMSRNALAQPSASTGPARFRFSLDQNWRFGGPLNDDALHSAFNDAAFEKVTLPHCVSKLSWQGWDPSQWQDVWVYRRHFAARPEFKNRRVFLDFDGVMNTALPVFNGKELPAHAGGYLPFHYEITSLLNDGDNVLALSVDARWNPVPPEGNPKGATSVDYLEPGGITRSVALRVVPPVFISDVFAKPVDVLKPDRHVEVTCTIDAGTIPEKSLSLKVEMFDGDRRVAIATKDLLPDVAGEASVTLKLSDLGNVKLWDVDAPQLYRIVATLMLGGEPLHDYQTRIGLREARFDNDGFYLNGRRLRFMGLDRHEVYPYTGFAMPPRVMRRDAEMIKREFNCNAVRCSHYPQHEAFLDACDELGLLVWQETPGWQFIGDDAWKDLVVRDVQTMIRRDRNHPSIFIWGVRVNESRNDVELFQRTTAAARALDDSRPASGSMTAHTTKNWHEDIFSLDDYHSEPDGTVGIDEPLPGVPYMLSETVGQFSYGAKKGFNNKYRRAGALDVQTSQALYHAQAHDRAAGYPRFGGVIAWCAFDYSSLINAFNAIKCPGIADVFRIPKLGATFYQSQVAPEVRLVILPDFYWDFGGHSPAGPGKSSAIFSNCERLEIFVDGKSLASLQPDRTNYPNLKYPPFFCDLELDGGKKPELRIDGYVGNKLVLSKSFSSDAGNDQLFLAADDAEIIGDASDATRLVFKVVDKFGNERAFAGGQIAFNITGPGVIVGDNPFTLLNDSGGVGAVWIKTLPGATGSIVVKAVHSTLGEKSVTVNIKPSSSLEI